MEKADKRTEILRAAEQLFSELGYEGTSTRQIAKESGANMAMINYYFGSKEGVFIEIMTERISSQQLQLKEINELNVPVIEKLFKVIDQYTTKIFGNVAFHKMMYRELSLIQRPEMYSKITEAMAANRKVIENIVQTGIDSGVFKKVDVLMIIATIMSTITMVASQPKKVVTDPKFDINDEEQRESLRIRLNKHLQDLVTTFLIIPKNV